MDCAVRGARPITVIYPSCATAVDSRHLDCLWTDAVCRIRAWAKCCRGSSEDRRRPVRTQCKYEGPGFACAFAHRCGCGSVRVFLSLLAAWKTVALATGQPNHVVYGIQREGTQMTVLAGTWCPVRKRVVIVPLLSIGPGTPLSLKPREVIQQYIAAARVAKQVRCLRAAMREAVAKHKDITQSVELRQQLGRLLPKIITAEPKFQPLFWDDEDDASAPAPVLPSVPPAPPTIAELDLPMMEHGDAILEATGIYCRGLEFDPVVRIRHNPYGTGSSLFYAARLGLAAKVCRASRAEAQVLLRLHEHRVPRIAYPERIIYFNMGRPRYNCQGFVMLTRWINEQTMCTSNACPPSKPLYFEMSGPSSLRGSS